MATTRNRIIYQSQAVYAGPDKDADNNWRHETGAQQPNQLQRIQSANYSFDIARQDVNQFGNLAAIDRIVLESPTVGLDFSWYSCSFYNENMIGLKIDNSLSSCLTDILDNNADERSYYIRIVKDGSDAASFSSTDDADNSVIAIGNGFLSNYSLEASVGALPTASCSVEGLNMAFISGTGGLAPMVNASDGSHNTDYDFSLAQPVTTASSDTTKALKPGDVTLTIPEVGGGANLITDQKVQSFNVSFDLAREPINKLGSRFAFAREITFPVTVSMSIDAIVGVMKTGDLAHIIDLDSTHDVDVHMKKGGSDHIAFRLKGAKLDSQSYSSSIGDNQTVTMNFSSQIGSSTDSTAGLFLSGVKA